MCARQVLKGARDAPAGVSAELVAQCRSLGLTVFLADSASSESAGSGGSRLQLVTLQGLGLRAEGLLLLDALPGYSYQRYDLEPLLPGGLLWRMAVSRPRKCTLACHQ